MQNIEEGSSNSEVDRSDTLSPPATLTAWEQDGEGWREDDKQQQRVAVHEQPAIAESSAPYLFGEPIQDGEPCFIARSKIVEWIRGTLRHTSVVLYGQRRIGKSTILLWLEKRLSESFRTVHLDQMRLANQPLGEILYGLAVMLSERLPVAVPARSLFDDQGEYFETSFWPTVQAELETLPLVLLLDELDHCGVINGSIKKQASGALRLAEYLPRLIKNCPDFRCVAIIGRQARELSLDFAQLTMLAKVRRIPLLSTQESEQLVRTAERFGPFKYSAESIQRIVAWAGGHPYLTQVLCNQLWQNSHAGQFPHASITIEGPDVDSAIDGSIQQAHSILGDLWASLRLEEKMILRLLTRLGRQSEGIDQHTLMRTLAKSAAFLNTGQAEDAFRRLREWGILRKVKSEYMFAIPLFNKWIARNHLDREGLDASNTLGGLTFGVDPLQQVQPFIEQDDFDSAIQQLRLALKLVPDSTAAYKKLAELLIARKRPSEAVLELERAFSLDPPGIQPMLVQALHAHADAAERGDQIEDAQQALGRILNLNGNDLSAKEKLSRVLLLRCGRLLAAGELGAALDLARHPHLQQHGNLKARQLLLLAVADRYEQRGDLVRAMETVRLLKNNEPQEPRWTAHFERLRALSLFPGLLQDGEAALQERRFDEALRVLGRACELRPEHQALRSLLEDVLLKANLEQHKAVGEVAFRSRKWQAVVPALAKVLAVAPDTSSVKDKLFHAILQERAEYGSAAIAAWKRLLGELGTKSRWRHVAIVMVVALSIASLAVLAEARDATRLLHKNLSDQLTATRSSISSDLTAQKTLQEFSSVHALLRSEQWQEASVDLQKLQKSSHLPPNLAQQVADDLAYIVRRREQETQLRQFIIAARAKNLEEIKVAHKRLPSELQQAINSAVELGKSAAPPSPPAKLRSPRPPQGSLANPLARRSSQEEIERLRQGLADLFKQELPAPSVPPVPSALPNGQSAGRQSPSR